MADSPTARTHGDSEAASAAPPNPAEKPEEKRTREVIQKWAAELTHHLEMEDLTLDIDAVLAIAGQAAHTVVRPSAPVTTFLVGCAVGRAESSGRMDFEEAFQHASGVTQRLLAQRTDDDA